MSAALAALLDDVDAAILAAMVTVRPAGRKPPTIVSEVQRRAWQLGYRPTWVTGLHRMAWAHPKDGPGLSHSAERACEREGF